MFAAVPPVPVVGGGLRVIVGQVIVDILSLIGLWYSSTTKQNTTNIHILIITATITIVYSGGNLTNRWTIIFPMIPLLFLQILRSILLLVVVVPPPSKHNNSNNNNGNQTTNLHALVFWSKRLIGFLSCLLIIVSGILSTLFPPVELPPRQGRYQVGVIDVFLPINNNNTKQHRYCSSPIGIDNDNDSHSFTCPAIIMNNNKENDNNDNDNYVTVRILYPTMDQQKSGKNNIPYLNPITSKEFCEESMRHGSPQPLRKLSWMLHYWRLIKVAAKRNAMPLDNNDDSNDDINDRTSVLSSQLSLLPLVFYSHGLGGNAELYTYQTTALAANGYVVVAIDHTDGSAPVVRRKDGTIIRRDESLIMEDWLEGRKERYKRSRRAMTEYRSNEFVNMVDAVLDLNKRNIPELEIIDISFVNKFNLDSIHYMGHSFGGATVFHAARQRRPTSVIAHEPVSDWIPDATRSSLFDWKKVNSSSSIANSTPSTTTSWEYLATNGTDNYNVSLHDDIDMLVLFSEEWERLGWGGVDVLQELNVRGIFGRNGGPSAVQVIRDAHHQEFSDVCMLTPLWLGKTTNLTNPTRNPIITAKEISDTTLSFLIDVEKKQKKGTV